jgi:O-antigen/teichoic acid export membrane protein
MSLVRQIADGFKAEIGGRILYFATTGAVLILLARLLDPGPYGVIFLAFSLLSVAQLGADLSMPESAARYIAEYDQIDPGEVGHIVTIAFLVVVAASTLVATLLAVFHRQIALLFDEPTLGPVLLVGGAFVFSRALYRYFRKILQGFKFIGSSATVYGIEGINRLICVIVFVPLLGLGAMGAISGYTLGYASAAVIGAAAFYRYGAKQIELGLRGSRTVRTSVLTYAVPLLTTQGAKVADNRLDTVLVGLLLSPAAVGFYTLGKQAVHLLQAPASALGFSAGPWYGDQKASGNVDRLATIYTTSLVHTLLLYLPIGAGMALLARPGLRIIFGEELSENALDYLGRARQRSIAKSTTAIANVAIIAVLIPVFGITGAAVAKVTTHTVYVGILLYIMHSEVSFGVGMIGRSVASIIVVTVAMSAIVFLATEYIYGPITLSVVILLGAVTWAGLSVYLGLVDIETARSVIK